ncbi:MAG: hypothetical protein ACI9BW_002228 [Gammaproteobacteria bacterium]|jgi:hypothetical protein
MLCKFIRASALAVLAQIVWTSTVSAADYRTIVAQHTGLCLDVQSASVADNIPIIQTRCNGSNSQLFDLHSATGVGQTYNLIAKHSGKCLDVPNADTRDGVPINQFTCDGSAEQRFDVLAAQRQHDYNLIASHSGKCAGFLNADTRDGVQLAQGQCDHSTAQAFQFAAAAAQAPVQAPPPQFAQAPPQAPPQQFNSAPRPVLSSASVMSSIGNQTEVTAFRFNNDSGFPLTIAWIDFNGQITAPGQPVVQPGFPWNVANGAKTWESHWFALSNASGFLCSIALRQGAVVNFSQLTACAGGNRTQFQGHAPAPPSATPINWGQTLEALSLSAQTGNSYSFSCPAGGNMGAPVWGTDVYTTDSAVCVAAVHRGLISSAAGGAVRLQVLGGQNSYHPSQRNNVSTQGYGPWQSSFSFQ